MEETRCLNEDCPRDYYFSDFDLDSIEDSGLCCACNPAYEYCEKHGDYVLVEEYDTESNLCKECTDEKFTPEPWWDDEDNDPRGWD